MNPRQVTGRMVAAAGLGASASYLLWLGPFGPGFAVWVALLGSSAVALAWREELPWRGSVARWSVVVVLAGLAMMWRAAPELQLLLFGVLVLAASMVVLESRGRRFGRTRVLDHVHGAVMVPVLAAGGGFRLLLRMPVPAGRARGKAWALGRGLLLAAIPLALFTGLFASADPVFERGVDRFTAILSENVLSRLALAGVFGWIGGGLLTGMLPGSRSNPVARFRPPRVGVEEMAVVLGLVVALFATFVVVQLGYLFGGRGAIESISGLTVAEYARRGFFELVAAAALVLVLLLAAGAASPGGPGRWVYRSLAGTLVALVLVVIASAGLRLQLYVDSFGLTTDRLYAAAFMTWLTATLLWFAATVIRGRARPFASGALAAGIVSVFGLAVLNPHAFVARTNLDRSATMPVDYAYLWSLSGDAVPQLIQRMQAIPEGDRCAIARRALERWGPTPAGQKTDDTGDWRRWNAGVARAAGAATRAGGELQALAGTCPEAIAPAVTEPQSDDATAPGADPTTTPTAGGTAIESPRETGS